MRTWLCLAVLSVVATGCDRDPGRTAVVAKTNAVSRLDDRGRVMETTIYGTNGAVKQRIFFEFGSNGWVQSTRTVDAEGKLKWTDTYSYDSGTTPRCVELQRVKSNGEAVAVKFVYS